MAARGKFLRTLEGGLLAFWCPGCDEGHHVKVSGPHAWGWDGNIDAPTFSPSVLVSGVQWGADEHFYRPAHSSVARGGKTICHSFVRGGKIEFLGDCTHALAGKTVQLPEFP